MGKKKKRRRRIKPLAICVFRRGGKIFLARGYDSVRDQVFYRPIGGRIEFGERGHETVKRELREEIGAKVSGLRYLGFCESIFRYEGRRGHELVLVYDGRFDDAALNRDSAQVEGRDKGRLLYEAGWHELAAFRNVASPPLYPRGLLDMLEQQEAI